MLQQSIVDHIQLVSSVESLADGIEKFDDFITIMEDVLVNGSSHISSFSKQKTHFNWCTKNLENQRQLFATLKIGPKLKKH